LQCAKRGEVGAIDISKVKSVATFRLNKFEDLRDIIVPIFCLYPLRTSKLLDFDDWMKAIYIKANSPKAKRAGDYILSEINVTQILELKQKMNTKRTLVGPNLIPNSEINAC
jgi:hypothetical protein